VTVEKRDADARDAIAFSIGPAIAKARRAHGMTQHELAGILGVKSGPTYISKLEGGTTGALPSLVLLLKMARVFGCTVSDLVSEVR
jgi:transcriptional regulator with XRE-family HTH domain